MRAPAGTSIAPFPSAEPVVAKKPPAEIKVPVASLFVTGKVPPPKVAGNVTRISGILLGAPQTELPYTIFINLC